MHWQLCGKTELEWEDQHTPEKVVENTGFKVLWDFNKNECDRMVEARELDIIFVHDKQAKEAKIISMEMHE